MGAWPWPGRLCAGVLLLWASSHTLQAAGRWDAPLAASLAPLAACWGPVVAVAVVRGGLALLHLPPHFDLLPPVPPDAFPGRLLRGWLAWPARGCLHASALALWLGLLAPARLLVASGKRVPALPLAVDAAVPPLGTRLRWPAERQALALLPPATLCWCLTDLGGTWQAPLWAGLWLAASTRLRARNRL